MNDREIERAIDLVLAMADRASDVVLEVYATNFAVDYKSPGPATGLSATGADPVTAADRRANAILCEGLEKEFPGVPVVAEESDPSLYAKWHDASAAWFVDPLDGTRDFVEKNGQFAVMVGLAEEGRASLGVVVLPALGRRFVGSLALGSFEVAADGSRKKIHVSSRATMAGASIVVSRSRPSKHLDAVGDALGLVRARIGSAGLKGIKVACAEADIYAHVEQAGYLWDGCAPEAIVRGAGGTVTDARGREIDYRSPVLANESGMVMSNGILHAAVIESIAKHRA